VPFEVRLPQFGMGMQEGTITRWYKREGETVTAGEPVAEVEAAKTTEDLPAPGSGVLKQILVAEGVTVAVNELLAVILTDAAEGVEDGAPNGPTGGRPPGAPVTPRARRLAKELGVALETVVGSGPGGRITEEDVSSAQAASAEDGQGAPTGETVAMSGMRATIAQRMQNSLQTSAQLTLTRTVDVTALVELRNGIPEPRPTFTDLIVRAAALALTHHRRLNSVLEGDRIRLLHEIHIGIATALEEGLVVPVVRHADRKSATEIAVEAAQLVDRVRRRQFSVDDVTGATFTVTSLGGQGIDAFTPIIDPPEAAILGLGRVVDHPARDGDALVWRKVTTLSLTIDHRIIDGAPAAAFLQSISELLQSPADLLL
jgi:pyruvate dehydrogenase E2 component (dihydrolipoamide acetyltransferase)